MGIIETIAVSLTARTKKFTTRFQRATRLLSKFGKRAAITSAKLGALGAAAAGVAGAGGMLAFTAIQFKAIDATAKFAQRIGVATEELTALRFAADQAGIAQQQFDTAMQRLVRRSEEVKAGTGEARVAFKNLGIDAAKFVQLSLEDKLLTLSERFVQLRDSGASVLNAFKLFDTEGVGLVTLLKQGPEQIRKLVAQAKRLGLTFTDFEAAKVEAANDAIRRMQALVQGAAQTLAIQFAPFVEAFANKMTALGTNGQNVAAKIVTSFQGVLTMLAKAVNHINLLSSAWFTFKGIVEKVAGVALSVLGLMADRIVGVLNLIPGVDITGPNFTRDFGFDLVDAAERSFAKAREMRDKFVSADLEVGISNFFDDLRAKADVAARKAAESRFPSLSPPAQARANRSDPFQARSLDLKNVFVGALNQQRRQTQSVMDREVARRIDTTNRLLRGMQGGGAVAA